MSQPAPVLIINLLKRSDRLINVIQQLDSVGLSRSAIRIQAVDSVEATENYIDFIDEVAYDNIEGELKSTSVLPTWGAVGCAMSHLRCWDYITDHNYPFGLVVEDDITITNSQKFRFNLAKAIRLIRHNLNSPAIITFNSSSHPNLPLNNNTTTIDLNIESLTEKFTGLHCYLINQVACVKLLGSIKPIRYQIDHQIGSMAFCRDKNLLSCVNLRNSGVRQNNRFSSDVQYYFITIDELVGCLPQLPSVVSGIIHSYLPPKLEPRGYSTTTRLPEWDSNHNIHYNLYDHPTIYEDTSYW